MGYVKAKMACCPICGNSIKIAATETNFSMDTLKQFEELMYMGYDIKSVPLHYARSNPMYCNHKPPFNDGLEK